MLQRLIADVIGAAARTTLKFNELPDEEPVRLEFTFDSRLESNGTGATMYTALANQPEWAESGIFDTTIRFDGGTGKSIRLEMGDLYAHEAMKELDRKITNIPPRIRASFTALESTKKFHFKERRQEYWDKLKALVNTPDSTELMRQFDVWLIELGQIDGAGRPIRSMNSGSYSTPG